MWDLQRLKRYLWVGGRSRIAEGTVAAAPRWKKFERAVPDPGAKMRVICSLLVFLVGRKGARARERCGQRRWPSGNISKHRLATTHDPTRPVLLSSVLWWEDDGEKKHLLVVFEKLNLGVPRVSSCGPLGLGGFRISGKVNSNFVC